MTLKKQPNSKMCFICGMKNIAGVKVFFYEQDDGSVLARFTGREIHQGYPGRMHGGVISGILDETMGRAVMFNGGEIWGVTVALEARFKHPVPLDVELTAVGRIVKDRQFYFKGTGELRLPDGTVAVEATGKYWKMPLADIADFDAEPVEGQVVELLSA